MNLVQRLLDRRIGRLEYGSFFFWPLCLISVLGADRIYRRPFGTVQWIEIILLPLMVAVWAIMVNGRMVDLCISRTWTLAYVMLLLPVAVFTYAGSARQIEIALALVFIVQIPLALLPPRNRRVPNYSDSEGLEEKKRKRKFVANVMFLVALGCGALFFGLMAGHGTTHHSTGVNSSAPAAKPSAAPVK